MIHIDKRMIQACLVVAPKDDIRYYLNAIKIEATKTHTAAIATDGHRLFAIRQAVENQIDEDVCFILPLNIAMTMCKQKMPKTTFQQVDDKFSVRLIEGDMMFNPVFGNFPKWDEVYLKQCNPGPQIDTVINGEYIGDFGKIAKIIGPFPRIMLTANVDHKQATLVSFDTKEFEAAGMVMPIARIEGQFYPRSVIKP